MDSALRVYLLFFVIAFVLLVFVVPSVHVYRKTGVNPFRFQAGGDTVHDFVGRMMKLLMAAVLVVVMVYTLFPTACSYLAPVIYLSAPAYRLTGFIICHVSLLAIIVAQRQMKLSWRIGIDFENNTPLVTHGLFAVSRNPVFLFLLTTLAGLFLILPNAVTLVILVAAYIVLQVTIRGEEMFLLQQHGHAYELYKRKVKRLI